MRMRTDELTREKLAALRLDYYTRIDDHLARYNPSPGQ